uniref:RNA-directed DNA polymerase n=1 Tax=Bracon brevicornis TaxID=1563983 RepID=A0A6V7JG03_9HYME
MEYNFTIIHRKGALHHVPDALSRSPEGLGNDDETIQKILESKDKWYDKKFRNALRAPDLFPDWRVEEGKLYTHRPSDYISLEMEDLDAWKLVVPRDLRNQVISQCHKLPQSGHLGADKTYHRVYNSYFWPDMYRDIVKFVSSCLVCQKCKTENATPRGLMGRRTVEEPWTTVDADVIGSITPSEAGHCYALVLQYLFTKWVEIFPLRKASGKTIRACVEKEVIFRWGTPRVFFLDNGTEFVNKDIKSLIEATGMKHMTSPKYHPQVNPVERVNRVLKMMLRAFMKSDHREWDIHLQEFRFAYKTAFHSSLQTTPAFINLGREPSSAISLRRKLEGDVEIVPRQPQEWLDRMKRLDILGKTIVHAMNEASNRQAHYYNLPHRQSEFNIGDLVMSRTHPLSSAAKKFSAALVPPVDGPFVI